MEISVVTRDSRIYGRPIATVICCLLVVCICMLFLVLESTVVPLPSNVPNLAQMNMPLCDNFKKKLNQAGTVRRNTTQGHTRSNSVYSGDLDPLASQVNIIHYCPCVRFICETYTLVVAPSQYQHFVWNVSC